MLISLNRRSSNDWTVLNSPHCSHIIWFNLHLNTAHGCRYQQSSKAALLLKIVDQPKRNHATALKSTLSSCRVKLVYFSVENFEIHIKTLIVSKDPPIVSRDNLVSTKSFSINVYRSSLMVEWPLGSFWSKTNTFLGLLFNKYTIVRRLKMFQQLFVTSISDSLLVKINNKKSLHTQNTESYF